LTRSRQKFARDPPSTRIAGEPSPEP
jgi:hypothetical protein